MPPHPGTIRLESPPQKKEEGKDETSRAINNKEICNCIYISTTKKKREERTKLVPPNKELCNIIYPVFLDRFDEWKHTCVFQLRALVSTNDQKKKNSSLLISKKVFN